MVIQCFIIRTHFAVNFRLVNCTISELVRTHLMRMDVQELIYALTDGAITLTDNQQQLTCK